jgi:LysM repeat protein
MKNDTLGGIAKKNNTTIKMLQDLNGGLKSADGTGIK